MICWKKARQSLINFIFVFMPCKISSKIDMIILRFHRRILLFRICLRFHLKGFVLCTHMQDPLYTHLCISWNLWTFSFSIVKQYLGALLFFLQVIDSILHKLPYCQKFYSLFQSQILNSQHFLDRLVII